MDIFLYSTAGARLRRVPSARASGLAAVEARATYFLTLAAVVPIIPQAAPISGRTVVVPISEEIVARRRHPNAFLAAPQVSAMPVAGSKAGRRALAVCVARAIIARAHKMIPRAAAAPGHARRRFKILLGKKWKKCCLNKHT